MNKLMSIIPLIVIVFSLTACTPAPKKSSMVPNGPALPLGGEPAAGESAVSVADTTSGAVFNDADEKAFEELADISTTLDDDLGLREMDTLVDIEI